MSDLSQILLTSALTIFGAIVVFILGEWILKFVLEPIRDLRRTIGEVRYSLAFHAQIILTPVSRTKERSEETRRELLRLSCELYMHSEAIPWRRFITKVSNGFVPDPKRIRSAAIGLRTLSTYVHETGDKASKHSHQVQGQIEKVELALQLPRLGES